MKLLTAMARTLRADRELERPASPLTRGKLWELFTSFTRAQYRDGGATPWAIVMLELDDDGITSMTSYLDVATLFPRFGVPMRLIDG